MWKLVLLVLLVVALPAASYAGELTTTYAGGNGHRGAMFDLTVLNPAGIDITSFDFNARSGSQGQPADIEIYFVTDHTTYVGKESNSALWTLMGSVTLPDVNATGTPTPVPIGGEILAFGETVGIYFTRSDGLSIEYTNGPLGVFENTDLRFEDRGVGVVYPFGNTYDPRIWNGTIHYDIVPEPATALSFLALGGLALLRRR